MDGKWQEGDDENEKAEEEETREGAINKRR